MNSLDQAGGLTSFCVLGAGAVGAHIAARLALGGYPVSVLARGAQLSAIQQGGLLLELPGQTLHAQASRFRASDDAAALGPADVVIVTVKSPAVPAIAPLLPSLTHPNSAVLFVQNGIPWWYFQGLAEPDPEIVQRLRVADVARHVSPDRVLGGVVHSSSHIARPGVVSVERLNNRLIVGEPGGGRSGRLESCAEALAASGFQVDVSERIRDEIWLKLALNAASGPQCVLADSSLGDTFDDAFVLDSLRTVAQEMRQLAQALGCGAALEGMDIEAFVKRISGTRHRPSILQDFDLRRPVEVEALYQLPVDLARAHGVPVPMLGLLTALVRRRALTAGVLAGD